MVGASPVTIERIRADEGLTLRAARIRSVADSPIAFGQSISEVRDRPESDWQRDARRSARGASRIWLFARGLQDDQVVGLVQGRRRRPSTLLLFSMWVDPGYRRLRVGERLVDDLERWAVGWSATETVLWVLSRNEGATSFYRRLGFRQLQDGDDAASGARVGAIAMRRAVAAPASR